LDEKTTENFEAAMLRADTVLYEEKQKKKRHRQTGSKGNL
jgi:hypothetical protein